METGRWVSLGRLVNLSEPRVFSLLDWRDTVVGASDPTHADGPGREGAAEKQDY